MQGSARKLYEVAVEERYMYSREVTGTCYRYHPAPLPFETTFDTSLHAGSDVTRVVADIAAFATVVAEHLTHPTRD